MTQNDKACELLQHVGNELMLLWLQIDTYQELFVLEQGKRKPLQERTASGFFNVVQITLAETILMRLFRLLDPKEFRGGKNSSIQHLNDMLTGDDPAQSQLKKEIAQICADWNSDSGSLASLKVFRNKLLAHNDFAIRSQLDANQLWMNLSANDLFTARKLANRLWSLYRQGNLALRGTDVVEPAHASIQNRPAMILQHLCASQYLDNEIKTLAATGEIAQLAEELLKLRNFEIAHMGEDRQHPVFDSAN